MKARDNLDLFLIALCGLALVPAVLLTDLTALRLALGIPFLLFAPGYALMAALFPARTSLSPSERLAYSTALSIAIVILDGLLLNYVWAVDTVPLLTTLGSLTLIALVAAWWRRQSLDIEERPRFGLRLAGWPEGWLDRVLIVTLALAIVGAGATAVYTGLKNIEPYSELFILGQNGQAADYPQRLAAGQSGSFTLVLANHERQETSYTLRVVQAGGQTSIDGNTSSEVSLTLADGGKQEWEITFSFNAPGAGQRLEFDLYKGGVAEVYLRVYLSVDVS